MENSAGAGLTLIQNLIKFYMKVYALPKMEAVKAIIQDLKKVASY